MSHTHCSIVPPYLLQHLAAGQDAHLAAYAQRTLDFDSGRRRAQQTRSVTGSLPAPAVEPRAAGAAVQRTIYDAQQGTDLPGTQVRAEGEPASGDEAVDQAYDALGDTWSLFHDVFGRNSLDDKGLPLLATVHYDKLYDNAFWDGSQMVFGDGDGQIFLGFTRSIDVIGHELTHGVTQYTAGLNYQGQSGALNESLSDVFGVLVKQRVLGQSADEADWLIGADLLAPGVKGVALRSMKAPGTAYDDPRLGTDPQPADMASYVDTVEDNGGVHINSGIPNRAFYLAATAIGGHAWQDAGAIWFDVLTGDIKADCDFVTFAELTLAAATARFGADSTQAAAVAQAWDTVGVTGSGTGSSPEPPPTSEPTDQAPSDQAPSDEAPRDQAPLPVPVDATVTLRRTGGIAGQVRQTRLVLRDLPSEDTQQWQSLLASRTLQAAVGGRMVPDAFVYQVICGDCDVDVVVPEPALTGHQRSLLERTLDFGRGL